MTDTILNILTGIALILSLFTFVVSKDDVAAYDARIGKFLAHASETLQRHLAVVLGAIGVALYKLFDLIVDAAPGVGRMMAPNLGRYSSDTVSDLGALVVPVLWVVFVVCSGVAVYLLVLWLLQLTCRLLATHEKGVVGTAQALIGLLSQFLKLST